MTGGVLRMSIERCSRDAPRRKPPGFVVQLTKMLRAGVSELADEPDSKSGALHWACGFKSHLRHHFIFNNIAIN